MNNRLRVGFAAWRACWADLAAAAALGWTFLVGAPPPAESPILRLEDVIGIEATGPSAANRAASRASLTTRPAKREPFSLQRRIFRDALDFDSVQVRSERVDWISATLVGPWDVRSPPGVFLLDAEIRNLRLPYPLPEDADLDAVEGAALVRTPLGSYLVGAGFRVAFPSTKTLRRIRQVPVQDWMRLIEEFRRRGRIDPESLFLVATRESMELAFQLNALMDLAGVVVEEPHYVLFQKDPRRTEEPVQYRRSLGGPVALPPLPLEVPPDGTPLDPQAFNQEVAGRYIGFSKAQRAPLLIIAAKDSPAFEFNKSTLLLILARAEAKFGVVLLDTMGRLPAGQRPAQGSPAFIANAASLDVSEAPLAQEEDRAALQGYQANYHPESMERWIDRMLQFCVEHAKTKPEPLPVPDPEMERQAERTRSSRQMGLGDFGGDPGGFSSDTNLDSDTDSPDGGDPPPDGQ